MKKVTRKKRRDELRPEYDLAQLMQGAVLGKHLADFRRGTNLVLLDPDIAGAFTDDAAVNEALRLALRLASLPRVRRGRRAPAPARHP